MTPAEMRAVIFDHGGTVDEDKQEGNLRLFIAIMRGPDMLGSELTPMVTVIFQGDRMRVVGIDYYYLPHQQGFFVSNERCSQIFTQVAGDLVAAYGSPTSRRGEPNGTSHLVDWEWDSTGRYVDAWALYDQYENRCGIVRATLFDGDKAQYEAFVKEP